jgi:alpha-N-arabinofuranosidase
MTLTPTYHVFEMYKVHQDAEYLPLDILTDCKEIRDRRVGTVNASASRKDGVIHITLANIDVEAERNVTIDLSGAPIGKVSGRILTSKNITDHNTFDKPESVKPQPFNGAKNEKGKLNVKLPAKAIVVLEIK